MDRDKRGHFTAIIVIEGANDGEIQSIRGLSVHDPDRPVPGIPATRPNILRGLDYGLDVRPKEPPLIQPPQKMRQDHDAIRGQTFLDNCQSASRSGGHYLNIR
jgi:hypothetical protein